MELEFAVIVDLSVAFFPKRIPSGLVQDTFQDVFAFQFLRYFPVLLPGWNSNRELPAVLDGEIRRTKVER